jgi:hypothetical protein
MILLICFRLHFIEIIAVLANFTVFYSAQVSQASKATYGDILLSFLSIIMIGLFLQITISEYKKRRPSKVTK